MPIADFIKGQPITADHLNRVTAQARRVENTPGALGGSLLAPVAGDGRVLCVVVERTIDDGWDPALGVPLHAVTYRVRVPSTGRVLACPWNKRIVEVQPGLIGPDADPVQLFWPAAVAGSDESARDPWRSMGEVVRGWTPEGQDLLWVVRLFGEVPFRGC